MSSGVELDLERFTDLFWHERELAFGKATQLKIFYIVRGSKGAVSLSMWFNQMELGREFGVAVTGEMDATAISVHGYEPSDDEIYGDSKGKCNWLHGGECYNHGHGYIIAEEPFKMLKAGNTEGAWEFLESFYDETFGGHSDETSQADANPDAVERR